MLEQSESTRCLRAVEGERVRLPLLDPVRLVEPRREPVGVGVEAGGERVVPPDARASSATRRRASYA